MDRKVRQYEDEETNNILGFDATFSPFCFELPDRFRQQQWQPFKILYRPRRVVASGTLTRRLRNSSLFEFFVFTHKNSLVFLLETPAFDSPPFISCAHQLIVYLVQNILLLSTQAVLSFSGI